MSLYEKARRQLSQGERTAGRLLRQAQSMTPQPLSGVWHLLDNPQPGKSHPRPAPQLRSTDGRTRNLTEASTPRPEKVKIPPGGWRSLVPAEPRLTHEQLLRLGHMVDALISAEQELERGGRMVHMYKDTVGGKKVQGKIEITRETLPILRAMMNNHYRELPEDASRIARRIARIIRAEHGVTATLTKEQLDAMWNVK